MQRVESLTRTFVARVGVLLGVCLLASGPAVAHSPSAEQLETFRNLPPDQQQAILRSMGAGQSGSTWSDQSTEAPVTVRPRPVDAEYEQVSEPFAPTLREGQVTVAVTPLMLSTTPTAIAAVGCGLTITMLPLTITIATSEAMAE